MADLAGCHDESSSSQRRARSGRPSDTRCTLFKQCPNPGQDEVHAGRMDLESRILTSMSRGQGSDDYSRTPIPISNEAELGSVSAQPLGTLTERTASGGEVWSFICVGRPRPEVRAILGWHQENIWLRQEEHDYILSKRASLMASLTGAIQQVLDRPLSVHDNPRVPGTAYFFCDGDSLRDSGLLQSTRVPFVDLVVEERRVLGGSFLRVTHFSPTRRNRGGRQLWP